MKDPKNFIKNQKIKKALGDFDCKLTHGDKLSLFNNIYRVISPSDQYVILEDEKNNRIALPTDRLKLLIKKGITENKATILKANISAMAGKRSGVSPKGVKDMSSVAPGTGTGKPRGVPVGTERQSADGQWYRKIADNPSKWAHVTHGSVHHGEEPGGEKQHFLSNDQDAIQYHKVMSKVSAHVSGADATKIEGMLKDYIETKQKMKGNAALHRVEPLDESGSNRTKAFDKNRPMQAVGHLQDKAVKLFQNIQSTIRESILKKIKEDRKNG